MAGKALTIIISITFLLSAKLDAHPVGNFSVNQYSRLEISRTGIKLREVLDMAEIPTFQESAAIDLNHDGNLSQDELNIYAASLTPQFAGNLLLTVNGQRVAVKSNSVTASLAAGAGDLSTLKIVWDMSGDLPALADSNRLAFQNNNYTGRVGWNEIVIQRNDGVNIFDTTAFGNGLTNELDAYPQELIAAPLAERSMELSFNFAPSTPTGRPMRDRDGTVSTPVLKDTLAELIRVPEISPMVALFGLLVAFGLGAVHAMSPGHGKTIVGAYLVGSKGTTKHAVFLGLTVTITHTLGVFAIGLVTLFASKYILPERLMPILSFFSGLMVFFIGISLFKDRLYKFLGWTTASEHEHIHKNPSADDASEISHSHDGVTHTHNGTAHTHLPPERLTWTNLLALGISGGLLPCPSALVLMLAAISAGRILYGLVLTIAFSVGLAATLTIVGLVFLHIGNVFGRTAFSNSRVFKALPVFSAFIVAFVGALICYSSFG